jgi:4-oxalocrotonate tautomerase
MGLFLVVKTRVYPALALVRVQSASTGTSEAQRQARVSFQVRARQNVGSSRGTVPAASITDPGDPMPTIRVELMEGRTLDQKKALVQALTQAVVDTLGARPESVDILLFDIKPHDWATGGELWSDKRRV